MNLSFPKQQHCKDENGNMFYIDNIVATDRVEVLVITHSNCNICYNQIDSINNIVKQKPGKVHLNLLYTEFFEKPAYFTKEYIDKALSTTTKRNWAAKLYFDNDLSINKSLLINALPKIFIFKAGSPVISSWSEPISDDRIFKYLSTY